MCFIIHLIFSEFIFWLRCCNIYGLCVVTDRRLMPAFVRLSKDDVYRVRRACAESLCDISKCVNEDIRLGVLVEIFLRLTQDPSKLVKQSVLQQSVKVPSYYIILYHIALLFS